MSSETSTDRAGTQVRPYNVAPQVSDTSTHTGLQPWQFFVLAALASATAVTYIVRGQGVAPVVLLSLVMGAAALVGLAALRTLRPLVTDKEERLTTVGGRARAALEREKTLALRSIKELEFDRAMGKLSEDDFREMGQRLRARAARLIQQLDATEGYRARIEKDLARRLGERGPAAAAERRCASCATSNDADAKFCKGCGERL